ILAVSRRAHRLQHRGAFFGEARRAQSVADELRLRKKLVPPAVVAVRMSVQDATGRLSPHARVLGDELARMGQIPEGVAAEPAAAIDETGIAVAEPEVWLEAGVNVLGDLVERHE